MSDINRPSPDGLDPATTDDELNGVSTGGAAPETPEGQDLAMDPDGSGIIGGGALGLDEEEQTPDAEESDLDEMGESPRAEWTP
jgi:hypothetical protein